MGQISCLVTLFFRKKKKRRGRGKVGEGGADHSSLFCSLAIAPALLDPRWDLPVAIILTLQMLNLLNLLLGLETKLAMKKK